MFGRNPRNTVPATSANPFSKSGPREPSGLGQQPGAVRSPIQNISGPGPAAGPPPVNPLARKPGLPPGPVGPRSMRGGRR